MVMLSEGRQKVQLIGEGNVTKAGVVLITGASGGQAIGSGLQTSGFVINNVIVKVPIISQSGTSNYGIFYNSGSTAPGVWINGATPYRPYPGSGYVASGFGIFIGPGEEVQLQPLNLGYIRAAAETSGAPLTYLVEMVQVQS